VQTPLSLLPLLLPVVLWRCSPGLPSWLCRMGDAPFGDAFCCSAWPISTQGEMLAALGCRRPSQRWCRREYRGLTCLSSPRYPHQRQDIRPSESAPDSGQLSQTESAPHKDNEGNKKASTAIETIPATWPSVPDKVNQGSPTFARSRGRVPNLALAPRADFAVQRQRNDDVVGGSQFFNLGPRWGCYGWRLLILATALDGCVKLGRGTTSLHRRSEQFRWTEMDSRGRRRRE
jgi:hypothetical protein